MSLHSITFYCHAVFARHGFIILVILLSPGKKKLCFFHFDGKRAKNILLYYGVAFQPSFCPLSGCFPFLSLPLDNSLSPLPSKLSKCNIFIYKVKVAQEPLAHQKPTSHSLVLLRGVTCHLHEEAFNLKQLSPSNAQKKLSRHELIKTKVRKSVTVISNSFIAKVRCWSQNK